MRSSGIQEIHVSRKLDFFRLICHIEAPPICFSHALFAKGSQSEECWLIRILDKR